MHTVTNELKGHNRPGHSSAHQERCYFGWAQFAARSKHIKGSKERLFIMTQTHSDRERRKECTAVSLPTTTRNPDLHSRRAHGTWVPCQGCAGTGINQGKSLLANHTNGGQTSADDLQLNKCLTWDRFRYVREEFWNVRLLMTEFDCSEVTLCGLQKVKIH